MSSSTCLATLLLLGKAATGTSESLSSHNVVVGVEGSFYDETTMDALEDKQNEHDNHHEKPLECGIWLAPSTIPGAGLGMFAGRDFAESEHLLPTGDVVIPIVDVLDNGSQFNSDDWTFLWDEYTWNADGLRMNHEGYREVNAASPGFGAAANCFLPIYNVEEGVPRNDAAGLHRSKDPGAGGFSSYYDRQSTAKVEIGAGQELFASYGGTWFESRPQLGPIPLYDDLDHAQVLVEAYQQLPISDSTIKEELWDGFVRQSPFQESRVLGAFHHDDPDELTHLESMTVTELRIEGSKRSQEWLREHGACGDHLRVDQSTIKQAGRGAFSTRDLPAGTLVSALPLIHIPERERLAMYRVDANAKQRRKRPNKQWGQFGYQVLLNYCFGHAESSLLLCPYATLAGHINHNQTLANVALRWSDPTKGNHMPHLLNESIEALEADATAKLALELFATREIRAGEEVFLDYGSDWEEAWQQHLATWTPVDGAESYLAAWQLNADTDTLLRTSFEQLETPYPENVDLLCDSTFLRDEWEDHYADGTLEEYLVDQDGDYYYCDILKAEYDEDGQAAYTLVIQEEGDDGVPMRDHLIEEVPRAAVHFVDHPYTSDLFLENAFRHDMRLPDDLFPQAWKNRNAQHDDATNDDDDAFEAEPSSDDASDKA